MNLYSKIVPLVIMLAFIFSSCSDKESLKEIEMKKMKEQLSTLKVDFYKAVKVTVRSTAAMPNDPEFV